VPTDPDRSPSSDPATSFLSTTGLRLPVWAWVVLWLLVVGGGAIALHVRLHGGESPYHVALVAFLAINLLITTWELALFARSDDIADFHARGIGPRSAAALFTLQASPRDALSSRLWALVWLTYCRYDDGYADRRSYGFTIDVSNGIFTPIPTVLFLVGMSVEILSPFALGVLGLVLFWTKAYGTVLYFLQYVVNRRYAGHSTGALLGNVVATNGVWILFPSIGLWVSLRLILDGSFAILRP
jgi:hypothetical protein